MSDTFFGSKIFGSVTTQYCYDSDQVIAEYDDSAVTGTFALVRKFIYGLGIDEPVCMINVDGLGVETLYFYHYDRLGNVVEQYTYGPFGETSTASTVGTPYMFTGRRYDKESGLYYYRARYYKPDLGRFLQPGPIGYDDGMNIYTYCGNNPVNCVDPWGLFRFGNRPLDSTFGRIVWYHKNANIFKDLMPITWISNATNLGLYHEHGFFEDGSHQNVGYFGADAQGNPQGILLSTNSQSENPGRFNYEISPWQYDDNIMRQAMQKVNNSGNFDPEDYKLMGSNKNNCQDYKTALRKEYKRLGGKVKYRPFGRRKRFQAADMTKRKSRFWVCIIIVTCLLAVLSFKIFTGFYPLPDLVYKLYYASQNEKERLDDILIDEDFKFYEKGYSVSRKITSDYPLPHFLNLSFESDLAPFNIESNLSLELKIFRKGRLVYNLVTTGGEKLFQRDKKGKLLGVSAIAITEIPFPLLMKAYKDITIEIEVLEDDEDLHQYIDKASLLLFPNIKIE